jgi:hypothetical protein
MTIETPLIRRLFLFTLLGGAAIFVTLITADSSAPRALWWAIWALVACIAAAPLLVIGVAIRQRSLHLALAGLTVLVFAGIVGFVAAFVWAWRQWTF